MFSLGVVHITGLLLLGPLVVHCAIQQFGACKAKVDNHVFNLEPLQKTDGKPRFSTKNNGSVYSFNPCVPFNMPSDPHQGKGDRCYYVAICESRTWGSGFSTVHVDDSSEEETSDDQFHYYTLAIQNTATFHVEHIESGEIPYAVQRLFSQTLPDLYASSSEEEEQNNPGKTSSSEEELDPSEAENMDNVKGLELYDDTSAEDGDTGDQPGTYGGKKSLIDMFSVRPGQPESADLSRSSSQEFSASSQFSKITYMAFTGLGTYKNSSSFIYLLCNHSRRSGQDAGFELLNVPNTRNKHFVLHHQCACPDGCLNSHILPLNNNLTGQGSVPGEEGEGPRFLWIILVINGGIVAVAVLIGAVFCRNGGTVQGAYYNMLPALHSSRLTLGTSTESLFAGRSKLHRAEYLEYSSAITKAAQLPVASDGHIASRDLDIGQRLGGGLFGDTYLGEWKERRVAAKRITVVMHQNQLIEEDVDWITKELTYFAKQKHKNIIAVLGFCADARQPYIVTEFFDGESVKDRLKKEDDSISWQTKVKWCLQVADGMAFLHSAKYLILHRDLRCANILVDNSERLKIVDFGMTKIVQRLRQKCHGRKGCFCKKEMSALPGSVRWTAPEVLAFPTADEYNHFDILAPPCDMYSYAMVLWEIATCMDPFEDIPDVLEVIEIVVKGGRPPIDTVGGIPSYISDTMKKCWSHDPDNRPTFKTIATLMKTFLQTASRRTHKASSSTSYIKSLLNTS